jgi:hypothetical protein
VKGVVGAMLIFYLNWLDSRMLCGKNMMTRVTFLPEKIQKENWKWSNLYCTLPENYSRFQVTNPIFPKYPFFQL